MQRPTDPTPPQPLTSCHGMRPTRTALALVCALSLAAGPALGQDRDPAEAEVLAAVQALFDAMAAGDSTAAADVLLAEGVYFAAASRDGEPVHEAAPQGDFPGRVAAQSAPWIERMWDVTVLVHDPIAVVWTPYDFHVGEEFSHCGVDAFSLLRTPTGWKIAGIVFTREREGCPESPIGPVGGS